MGSLSACAQVLGVDDYSKSETLPVGAAAPFDEKPPYLMSERCQRCIAFNCGEQQRACAANAVCTKWFDDMRINNFGPIADHKRRFLDPLADANRARAVGDGPDPLATVEALTSCLGRQDGFRDAGCLDYCDLGRDFSCVPERFAWPPTKRGSKDLLVRLVDEGLEGVAGWQVRYCGTRSCGPSSAAESASAQGETDAQGFASLSAEVEDNPAFRYLLASATTTHGYPFLYPLPSGPLHSGIGLEEPAWSKDAVDAELRAVGTELSPTEAVVWVFPRDCMGNPARGVTIDVLTADRGNWTPCSATDCLRIYPGTSGDAEVGQHELSFGPRALLTNLPATGTWLIVRDSATHDAVAQQKLEPQPGTVHVVTLYPASGAEQDELAQLPLP